MLWKWPSPVDIITLFFVVLALSLHSLFEGLAIGLEESIDDVWTFFIGRTTTCYLLQTNQRLVTMIFPAIASHKFVVSFCVSLEMQQSGTRLPMFLTYLSVFRSVEDGVNLYSHLCVQPDESAG